MHRPARSAGYFSLWKEHGVQPFPFSQDKLPFPAVPSPPEAPQADGYAPVSFRSNRPEYPHLPLPAHTSPVQMSQVPCHKPSHRPQAAAVPHLALPRSEARYNGTSSRSRTPSYPDRSNSSHRSHQRPSPSSLMRLSPGSFQTGFFHPPQRSVSP